MGLHAKPHHKYALLLLAVLTAGGGAGTLWASVTNDIDANDVQRSATLITSDLTVPTPSVPSETPKKAEKPKKAKKKATPKPKKPSPKPSMTVSTSPKALPKPIPTFTPAKPPTTVPKPTPKPTPKPSTTTPRPNPTYGSGMDQFEVDVLALVQKERGSQCPINSDDVLNQYARNWSKHMSDIRSMVHSTMNFPGNSTGENIAYGYNTPEEVMQAWMTSPGHRENIMDCSFKKIGIGYEPNGDYWTQDFSS